MFGSAWSLFVLPQEQWGHEVHRFLTLRLQQRLDGSSLISICDGRQQALEPLDVLADNKSVHLLLPLSQ